jgi:hypothetical protein
VVVAGPKTDGRLLNHCLEHKMIAVAKQTVGVTTRGARMSAGVDLLQRHEMLFLLEKRLPHERFLRSHRGTIAGNVIASLLLELQFCRRLIHPDDPHLLEKRWHCPVA